MDKQASKIVLIALAVIGAVAISALPIISLRSLRNLV